MKRENFARHALALAAAALCLAFSGAPRAEDRSAEVKALTEALQSSNVDARITALKKATNSGLTDRTLFDAIQKRLLAEYRVSEGDAKGADEVSWMCKALASSGLPEYRDSLAEVAGKAPSEKVRKYAQQSLGLIDTYAERNAQLAKQTSETEGLAPEAARLVNMLRAPDGKLKKDAAKMITRSSRQDPRVFEVVKDELVSGAKSGTSDSDQVDTLAWLCKALAASGDVRYRATLEQVAQQSGNEKLRKYAKQSLDSLR